MTTAWTVGTYYVIGNVVSYDELYYQARAAHTSQDDWHPSIDTLSIWLPVDASTVSTPLTQVPGVAPVVTTPMTAPLPVAHLPTTSSGTLLCPYLYTWGFGNSVYKITKCMDIVNKLGGNAVTMAFVIAGSGNQISQDIYTFSSDFAAFNAVGGQLIISFGGASGIYAEDQLSASDMVSQVSALIDSTGCKALDFDIEGSYLANVAINDKRSKIIATLQSKYPSLKVNFTLPSDTNGLSSDGIACIENAISNGVVINIVNIMAMDIGGLPSGKSWGATACAMGDTTIAQLKSLYPAKTSAQLFAMLGITPMLGVNDDSSVFTPNDAKILGAYAKTNNIGLIAFWAINRDQVGSGDLGVYSKNNNVDFEYYNNFKDALGTLGTIGGSANVSNPVPVVPAQDLTKDTWANNTKYTVGDSVVYSGVVYNYVNSHMSSLTLTPHATPSIWQKK